MIKLLQPDSLKSICIHLDQLRPFNSRIKFSNWNNAEVKLEELETISSILRVLNSSSKTFREMNIDIKLSHTLNTVDFQSRKTIVNQVLKSKLNNPKIIGFFDWARQNSRYKPCEADYKALIEHFRSSRNSAVVCFLHREMTRDGCVLDIDAYNILIDVYGRLSLLKKIEGLWLEMKQSGIKPNAETFSFMIRTYLKAGHLQKAAAIYFEMESSGIEASTKLLNMMITVYARLKDLPRAEQVFSRVLSSSEGPSIVSWTAMLDAYGKRGRFEEAISLYESMKDRKVDMCPIVYGSLIHIYGKSGKLQEAEDLFQDMTRQGYKPNIFHFSSILSNHARSKNIEGCERWLNIMEKEGFLPNAGLFCTLIFAYTTLRDYAKIREVLGKVKSMRSRTSGIYTILLSTFVDSTEERDKGYLLKLMEECGDPAHELTVMFLENDLSNPRAFSRAKVERILSRVNFRNLRDRLGLFETHLRLLAAVGKEATASEYWNLVRQDFGTVSTCVRSNTWILDLHRFSDRSSRVVLCTEFIRLRDELGSAANKFPPKLAIVTGKGNKSREVGASSLKSYWCQIFSQLDSPFHLDVDNEGRLVGNGRKVKEWLEKDFVKHSLMLTDRFQ